MVKRLSKEEFDKIYARVPRVCVDLIIEIDGGILLTKRIIDPYMGKWHLPGGAILFGESLEEAAIHTAKRELNVKIDLGKLVGTVEFNPERKENEKHAISLVFLAKIKSGELQLNEEANEFKIFKNGLPEEMILEHKNFLENFMGKKP